MFKLLLVAFTAVSLTACTHGSFAPKNDLDSARFARRDMCCAQTMNKISDTKYEAFGCGQAATYEFVVKKWQRTGPIRAGSGDPADKLKDCNQ
jgi:hypothetical protein